MCRQLIELGAPVAKLPKEQIQEIRSIAIQSEFLEVLAVIDGALRKEWQVLMRAFLMGTHPRMQRSLVQSLPNDILWTIGNYVFQTQDNVEHRGVDNLDLEID
eukprot:c14933_g1_i2.p1 GENE.c14933_g1_i2~~c14933_g1_i2.p1  ORF type:complete len:103 (+),score=20.53 c14933_g1_i2:200-508(+)